MDNINCTCQICEAKGWIETAVFSLDKIADGTLVIEKCDECNIFINDFAAAKFAFENHNIISCRIENGFNIKIEFSLN